MKSINKITAFLSIIISALLILSFSASAADQSNETVQQIFPCLKGNVSYYVSVGDKAQKGEPLFMLVSADNNSTIFYQLIHKIKYYTKMYNRRAELIKTNAVSKEELENNLNNLILAKDDLISYIVKFKQGFYVAPYDCEIVSIPYPNGCGLKSSIAAMSIKPVDPNYTFEPKKLSDKRLELYITINKLSQEQRDNLDVDKVIDLLNQLKQLQASLGTTTTAQ